MLKDQSYFEVEYQEVVECFLNYWNSIVKYDANKENKYANISNVSVLVRALIKYTIENLRLSKCRESAWI
jgi:hypothetical protein